jgi:small subunit ribosomal protein S17
MNNRRRMTGVVASDKMTKTVVVVVSRTYKHPLYKKVVHASSRFKAHNELEVEVGDVVTIVESRPLSRDKRWVVEKVVRRLGESAMVEPIAGDVAVEEPVVEEPVAEAAASNAAATNVVAAEAGVAEEVVEQTAAVEETTPEAETDQAEEADASADKVEGE